MRRADVYPHDALTGSCFITGDYDPAHGIVDLEIYLDTLPPNGRLCVSGIAVRDMVTALGWTWPSDDELEERVAMQATIENLRDENLAMRKALTKVLDAAKLASIETWMVAS